MADEYDGTDVFAVKRLDGGALQVKHYPHKTATVPCCNVRVTVTAKDRERGREIDDPTGAIPALARAQREIDKKHGRM